MKMPCPACQQMLNLPDSLAGKVATCPACRKSLSVPVAEPKQGLLGRISGTPPTSGVSAAPVADELALVVEPQRTEAQAPEGLTVCPSCGIKWRMGTMECRKCHFNVLTQRRAPAARRRYLPQFDAQRIFLYAFLIGLSYGGYWLYNNWYSVRRDISDKLDNATRTEPSADDQKLLIRKEDIKKLERD